MKGKILMISTFGDFFWSFERDNISILKSMGYEIFLAANFKEAQHNKKKDEVKSMAAGIVHIPFQRKPLQKGILRTLILTEKLIRELKPTAVDCHLAVTGAISRLACWFHKDIRIIYSPHGFFFYEGCPLINRILFKTTEYILAHKTDAVITINAEDYANANKMRMRGKAYYVPGVGIDIDRIRSAGKPALSLRKEIHADSDAFLFLSVGELSRNKNHIVVIEAMRILREKGIIDFHYVICGRDDREKAKLCELAKKYGLDGRVHYLGYRNDIIKLDKQVDAFILPSYKEGLSVSIMEAMACQLPVLASDIRGNRDMVVSGKGGYLFRPDDAEELSGRMELILGNPRRRVEMGAFNAEQCNKYSIRNVSVEMKRIYREILGDAG